MKRFSFWFSWLGLTAAYVLLGKLGLSLASVNASATPVWPPTGVALAALLIGGYRLWPAIFAGAFLVNLFTQGSVFTSLGIATGNTLEAVVGAALVNRYAQGIAAFEHPRNILVFVLGAAVLSTAISATLGVVTLGLGGFAGWPDTPKIWFTWWLGDLVSNCSIAPILLTILGQPRAHVTPRRTIELLLLIALACGVGAFVFLEVNPFPASHLPLGFLSLPPLIWAALRFGPRGAAILSALLAAIALWGTLHDLGPFAGPDTNQALLLVQTYMAVVTITTLVLAAAMSARYQAEGRLRTHHAVSSVLATAPALSDVGPALLRTLCETAGWEVGVLWRCPDVDDALQCAEFWHVPHRNFPEFEKATREFRFPRGTGLPGRAWATGQPVWISDVANDSNFPRAQVALHDGLRAGFSFPIPVRGKVVAVLECFSTKVRKSDPDFLQLMNSLGSQLGQFIERKAAEERLVLSEERHRAIAETAADGIVTMDEKGVIVSVNAAVERIFGYGAEALLGQPFTILIPERLRAAHERGLQRYLTTGQRHIPWGGIELPGRRHDGQEIPLEISFGQSRLGDRFLFTGIVRDISERKRAEEAVRSSQRQLQLMTDALPVLIGYIDTEQRYRFNNKAYEDWFGLTRESIYGLHIAELLGSEAYAMLRSRIESALRGEQVSFDADVPYQQGGFRSIHATYIPRRDDDDKVQGAFILVADVTLSRMEERRAKFLADATSLLNQSFNYKTTLQSLTELVVPAFADSCTVDIVDGAGAIERVAAAHTDPKKIQLLHELHRLSPTHVGEPLSRALQTVEVEWASACPAALLTSMARDENHLRLLTELGTKSYLIMPLTVRHKVLGALTLATAESDRSYSKADLDFGQELARRVSLALDNALLYEEVERTVDRRTEALQESNEQMQSFTYSVAHDLRAPLRGITGFSQVLREEYADALGPKGSIYLDRITEASSQMDQLIQDLLEYSRLSRIELSFENIATGPLFQTIVQRLHHEIRSKGAQVDMEESLPVVRAHPRSLEQVLTNLVVNALKFVPEAVSPHIHITSEPRGENVRIWIRDNGIGIPREYQEKIFGVFERLHSAEKYPGTGIGLAIVRKATERMGGSVGVESEPGQGSSFWIELPAAVGRVG